MPIRQSPWAHRASGLYRTEYLYLTHADVPDEDEQYETYRDIIGTSPNNNVTIRTLDIGGDKTVAYLGHNHQEANPFMGWRSIRLSFEHPEFFNTQIRAIVRAASDYPKGTVRLMFPMVTTIEEVRRLRSMVRRAYKTLASRGKQPKELSIGMMLEVPAAAVSIDNMLELVDFVSIGSNDLVQYLMAADRDNPKVSHLCQPLAPPVLLVLDRVIKACNRANVPVTVCGEMAGKPKGIRPATGNGTEAVQHESSLHSLDQTTGQSDQPERGRTNLAQRDQAEDNRSSQEIHDSPTRTNRTKSSFARYDQLDQPKAAKPPV